MNNRHDYGKNGVLIIDNVREHIERNDFPRIPIGSIAGMDGWFIKIRTWNILRTRLIVLYLCRDTNEKVPFKTSRLFNLIMKDGSSVDTIESYFRYFPPRSGKTRGVIEIDWLLNDENGCLNDNGGLTIEYGIHVKSIKGVDGIWKFNVFDKTFGNMGDKTTYMGEDGEINSLHYHKQFVKMGSKLRCNLHTFQNLANCFQIAHGVRIDTDCLDLCSIAGQAQLEDLSNVVRYCEQKLIEKDCGIDWMRYAIAMHLNHFLVHLIKNLKSSKELKDILEDVDIQMMSGEAMKQCAKFFYENSK